MTTVLKLGGSVITEKDTPETVDETMLDDLASAIAEHDDVALVHGAGSFGHYHASEHGVSTTEGTHDAVAVRDIHGSMKRLNDAVLDALADHGVRAVPLHPFSLAHRTADGNLHHPVGGVATALEEGFLPVLHGDVVVEEGAGATILSGDEIVVQLARGLGAGRVGLCSGVPGVLEEDGDVISRIGEWSDAAAALGESDATDVTGGMAAKVRELLALDSPAYVFDADGVGPFLDGDEPGTRVD
jgi:isopentenyl phosphate kinase